MKIKPGIYYLDISESKKAQKLPCASKEFLHECKEIREKYERRQVLATPDNKFVREYNKNIVSEDFMKQCKKAGRLFKRKDGGSNSRT